MSKTKKSYGPCSEKQRLILQDSTTDVILIGGGAGGGKALRHGELVLTPLGFKPIEQIKVGDLVITPSNDVETVLNIWPQGVVDIYTVTFEDGRKIDCCENHLWQYNKTNVGTTRDILSLLNKNTHITVPSVVDEVYHKYASRVNPYDKDSVIVSIDYCTKDYATCIGISGEEKLFITTDFIVTHNSRVCLIKNLDGIKDKHFKCTIFRRSYPELKRQGGLIDESKDVYPDFKGEYKSQAMVWKFPSGATIAFSAIASDDDLGSWQGSQLVRACIDEVGDKWTESQFLFLLSRLRSAHSKIHPQLIATCNPDVNSFLKRWVDYSLDPVTGVPVPGTENRIRWFVTLENKVLWADSPEECFELHGKPRGMVYARGISEEEVLSYPKEKASLLFMPKSFRFIPTGVFDNPYLLPPRNNSYISNLLSQPYVNQLKFLHGSWTAKESSSGYFKRDWVQRVDSKPVDPVACVRAWDFAATEPSVTSKDIPDWTVGVKMSRDRFGIYYIEDVVRFQARTDTVLKRVVETALADGLDECDVCIPVDPGASGKVAAQYYQRVLAEEGVCVKTKPISGHSSKLTRFKPLCALAESGSLKIVGHPEWEEDFFAELENFEDNNRKQKDDQVDAASDAFSIIAKGITLPTMQLNQLVKTSPIPTI